MRRFHNLMFSFILIGLIASGLIFPAQTQTTEIVVDPQSITAIPSNNFSVNIAVQNLLVPLEGFIIIVTWDPELMSFESVKVHVEDLGWQYVDPIIFGEEELINDLGIYIIIASDITEENPIINDANLFTLTFHCEGEGLSSINLPASWKAGPGMFEWIRQLLINAEEVEPSEAPYVVGDPIDHGVVGGTVFQYGPVAGIYTPVNKLAIVAPYLVLAGIVAVASAIYIKRRRR